MKCIVWIGSGISILGFFILFAFKTFEFRSNTMGNVDLEIETKKCSQSTTKKLETEKSERKYSQQDIQQMSRDSTESLASRILSVSLRKKVYL